MQEPWRIRMLGWLRATRGEQVVTRFPTRQTASLLAWLAYHSDRSHPREYLMEMLWPGSDPEAARNRFRVALSALRRILEPPDVPAGSVVIANRESVRLDPSAIQTDVDDFERALAGTRSCPPQERLPFLERAVGAYGGPLLPGVYEDWTGPERDRLAEMHVQALCCLSLAREEGGDLSGAIAAARDAVAADPLREEAHQRLMSLHLAEGQALSALRQYQDLRRVLRRELGQPPSPGTRALADSIRAHLREKPADAGASVPPVTTSPTPSPPRSPRAAASRLPVPISRFFGRAEEVRRLREMLEEAGVRLVTLTGPGGSGKTRLALEVAAGLADGLRGAVWFVPLAERGPGSPLMEAVADALRLRPSANAEPLEQVVHALSVGPALLILDNCEHVAEAAAESARALLERLPDLRILATSQVRIQVPGERELNVAPLPVPNGNRSPADLLEIASVGLFIDRAQAVRPDFQISERNADAVADICRRLEGLPLAIELAAAWAHTLTPPQMLQRLSSRFDILVSRGRDVFCRHRALRTTLEWSYELLPADLRRAFIRLSVMRSGWTLDMAQRVLQEPDLLDHVAALRERSLLSSEDDGAEMRFIMLDALHEYAAELIDPAERAALERRHAGAYLEWAGEAEAGLHSRDVGLWLERLEGQHDNLRSALEHFLTGSPDPEEAACLAGALAGFWEHHGHFQEGRRLLSRALAAGPEPSARVKALNGAGRLAVCQGEATDGEQYGAEALALASELGDRQGEALALKNLGFASFIQGRMEEAVGLDGEALARFRELGDEWGVAATLDDMGSIVTYTRNYPRATELLRESLALYRRLEHAEGVASALYGLGVLARDQGDYAAARELLTQTLEAGRELRDTLYVALSTNVLASVSAATGDLPAAREQFAEAERMFRELRDMRAVYRALYHRAMVVERTEDPAAALALMRESHILAHRNGEPLQVLFSLTACGALAADRGDWPLAARLLGAGEEMRRRIDFDWPDRMAAIVETAWSSVRQSLPEPECEGCRAEGASLPPEQASRLAIGDLA